MFGIRKSIGIFCGTIIFIFTAVIFLFKSPNPEVDEKIDLNFKSKSELSPGANILSGFEVVSTNHPLENLESKKFKEVNWNGPLGNVYSNLVKASHENPSVKTDEIVEILLNYVDGEYLTHSDLLKDAIVYVTLNTFQYQQLNNSTENAEIIEMTEEMYKNKVSEDLIEQFILENKLTTEYRYSQLEDQDKIFRMRFNNIHNLDGSKLIDDLKRVEMLLPRDQILIPSRSSLMSK